MFAISCYCLLEIIILLLTVPLATWLTLLEITWETNHDKEMFIIFSSGIIHCHKGNDFVILIVTLQIRGENCLRTATLHSLGLTGKRAVIRFVNSRSYISIPVALWLWFGVVFVVAFYFHSGDMVSTIVLQSKSFKLIPKAFISASVVLSYFQLIIIFLLL